jgi:hypothetical protein
MATGDQRIQPSARPKRRITASAAATYQSSMFVAERPGRHLIADDNYPEVT